MREREAGAIGRHRTDRHAAPGGGVLIGQVEPKRGLARRDEAEIDVGRAGDAVVLVVQLESKAIVDDVDAKILWVSVSTDLHEPEDDESEKQDDRSHNGNSLLQRLARSPEEKHPVLRNLRLRGHGIGGSGLDWVSHHRSCQAARRGWRPRLRAHWCRRHCGRVARRNRRCPADQAFSHVPGHVFRRHPLMLAGAYTFRLSRA